MSRGLSSEQLAWRLSGRTSWRWEPGVRQVGQGFGEKIREGLRVGKDLEGMSLPGMVELQCMCVHTHTHLGAHTVHVHICVCNWFIHVCVYARVFVHVCMQACAHVCMCDCACVCVMGSALRSQVARQPVARSPSASLSHLVWQRQARGEAK